MAGASSSAPWLPRLPSCGRVGETPLCTPPSNTPEGFAKTSQRRVRQGAGAQPDVQAACACVFGGVAVTTAAGAAQGSPREPWLGIRDLVGFPSHPGRMPQLSAPEERPRPHPGWWRSPRGPAGPRPEGTGMLLTAACHRGAQGEVRRDSELTSVLPRERGLSSPRWSPRGPGASCVPLYAGKARPQTQRAGARLSKGGLRTRIGGWRGTVPAGRHGDLGGLFPGSSLCCPCMSPVLTPKAEP